MEPSSTLKTILSLVQASRQSCPLQLLYPVMDQLSGWLEDRFEEFSNLEGGEPVLESIESFHLSLQCLADYLRSPATSTLDRVLLLAYQADDQLSDLSGTLILGCLWAA